MSAHVCNSGIEKLGQEYCHNLVVHSYNYNCIAWAVSWVLGHCMLYIRQTLSQKLKERGVGVQMLISEGGRGI